jgi:hypothetical protein
MALVKLQNFIADNAQQAASVELFARLADFNSYSSGFMTVNHSNNTVFIPFDTVLPFKKGAGLALFVVYDTDLVLSTSDLDVGASFTPGAEYYIYLINQAESGLMKISLNSDFPVGFTKENSLKIGKFLTAATAIPGYAPGDILTDSISDYRVWRSLGAAYPAGTIYVQYPGLPSPEALLPALLWRNITASYAGSFFRAEGGLSMAFETGLQAGSVPDIIGMINGVMIYMNNSASGALVVTASSYANNVGSGNNSVAGGISINASLSSSVYGLRSEVAPQNETVKIWRRIGTVTGQSTWYRYDIDGAFVETLTLDVDEVGPIGLNPNCMTNVPPESDETLTLFFAGNGLKTALVFDQAEKSWAVVPDTRWLTAYNKATAEPRRLLNFAQPEENETLVSPEGVDYPIWDEKSGQWLTDEPVKNQEEVEVWKKTT